MLVVTSLEHSVSYNESDPVIIIILIIITVVNDLCDVFTVIHDLNDWKVLGLQLGLLYPTLERIDREQRGTIAACKMHMLSAWLQQQDDVSKKGVPSWSVLRAALQKMGENELASKIQ